MGLDELTSAHRRWLKKYTVLNCKSFFSKIFTPIRALSEQTQRKPGFQNLLRALIFRKKSASRLKTF